MCRVEIALLFALNAVSSASTLSTVSVSGTSDGNPSAPTSCAAMDAASASCSINYDYGTGYNGAHGFGLASATSVFGLLTGAVQVNGSPDFLGRSFPFVQGQFAAEFSDPVIVTGDTGTGTLVAHFTWSADADTQPLCYECPPAGFWPSYVVSIGNSSVSWTAGAPATNVPLDFAAAFVFGQMTAVGASSSDQISTDIPAYSAPGIGAAAIAELMLTGFSVYDASGNLVPGAQVTVVGAEPGTWMLWVCGLLVLARLRAFGGYQFVMEPSGRKYVCARFVMRSLISAICCSGLKSTSTPRPGRSLG